MSRAWRTNSVSRCWAPVASALTTSASARRICSTATDSAIGNGVHNVIMPQPCDTNAYNSNQCISLALLTRLQRWKNRARRPPSVTSPSSRRMWSVATGRVAASLAPTRTPPSWCAEKVSARENSVISIGQECVYVSPSKVLRNTTHEFDIFCGAPSPGQSLITGRPMETK